MGLVPVEGEGDIVGRLIGIGEEVRVVDDCGGVDVASECGSSAEEDACDHCEGDCGCAREARSHG
jgi:hypothetical protein